MKQKITKKQFIEEITSRPSRFIGLVRQELTETNLAEFLPSTLQIELRTCRARSRDLIFIDKHGNKGTLDFGQKVKHHFQKIIINDNTILVYSFDYENEWGDSWSKYLYYLLQ